MDSVDEILSKDKISKSLGKPEGYECFVSGEAVGCGPQPISCILGPITGQTAKVVIAEGHDTGVEVSVPLSSISVVSEGKMEQAAKDLFRG